MAAGTQVPNQAAVTSRDAGPGFPLLEDPLPSNNTSSASLTVNPLADVSLTKTVSDSNPGTDAEVVYTLTAANAGPNAATGVQIHDSLPAGLDFINASPGCDSSAGTVTCDLGTVASGASSSVTIRAHATPVLAGSSVTNAATVSANEPDPDTTNNQATATINVQPLVDLELTKTASTPSPTAGGQITYTLTLLNNGPSPATDTTITDTLPSTLSFVSARSGQGNCANSFQTVVCRLGTLAPGGVTLVTITAGVADSAAGRVVLNTATAAANEAIARPNLADAEASVTPVAAPPNPGPPPPNPGPPPSREADLGITKTVNHRSGRTGEPLTYTVTVTNHGPATASNPTVTDVFSQPVTVASAGTAGGSCAKGHTIVCKLGSIPSGTSVKITIVARPMVTGSLRNSASVASPTPDPDQGNNVAHVTANVRPGPAGLRLSKTASRRQVAPGQAFGFTIVVRSLGPQAALGVKVCDRLGSGMTFISARGASFRHGSPCWTISSLAKNRRRRFDVRVRAGLLGGRRRLINAATASADGVRRRTAQATVKLVGKPPVPRPGGVTG